MPPLTFNYLIISCNIMFQFHGDCVGITEERSKGISEFVCDGCSITSDNQDIYCLCQQPYDNTQAYIGCDGCPDWFHGRCVGILEKETQKINQYFCPRCSPNSELNLPNFKALNEKDYDLVKKLIKQLLVIIYKKDSLIMSINFLPIIYN